MGFVTGYNFGESAPMMKISLGLLLMSTLLPTIGWAGPSNCYSIKDSDLKHQCLAITKNSKSRCYSIKNKDLKNSCLAQVGNQKSRCYSIKDKDLKNRCLADF